MKLFLIRHGQTTGDLEDRYGGTYDDHLTELGHEQLQATAEKLARDRRSGARNFCNPCTRRFFETNSYPLRRAFT